MHNATSSRAAAAVSCASPRIKGCATAAAAAFALILSSAPASAGAAEAGTGGQPGAAAASVGGAPGDSGSSDSGDAGSAPVPDGHPVPGGFVVNGGGQGDWGFVMGPIGAAGISMKLIRANADRSGAVGFLCARADGAMQLAVALPGAAFKVGEERELAVSIPGREAKLRTVVRAAPPAGSPPVFESAGMAVPDLLKSMGAVEEDAFEARLAFDDGAGHKASFDLPKPRGVASAAAEVCSGWGAAVHAAAVPDDAGIAARLRPAADSEAAAPSARPARGLVLPAVIPPTGPVHDPD
jgi:hypothetical protein